MNMYVRQSENVYSKVQIQAAILQNQKFKTVFTELTNFYKFLRILKRYRPRILNLWFGAYLSQ